jgi:hypothetical protein
MSTSRAPGPVVEYESFRSKAARLLEPGDRERLVEFLAANPRAGKEYEGTGGVRHLRWPVDAERKEQFDVGYYYGDGSTPVLIVALAKKTEGNLLSKVIRGLAIGS